MTTQSITSRRPAELSSLQAIIRLWRERQHRIQACRALLKFDDHMLEDIGLTRGDVAEALHGRAPLSRS